MPSAPDWVAGVLRGAARLLLRVFFRSLEVVGRDLVPAGPLVVVANHVNGLVDPLLVMAALPAPPRFLAKSTLWKIWPLRPLLWLAGAVPVYRRHDPGVDPARNLETFAHSRRVLAAGGTIALFPEGISHDQPGLQPLKSGAARMALEAESEARGRGRALGVRILPLGLAFDARESFRSRALVRIGEPLDPAAELLHHAEDPVGATAALTARIEEALAAVTLNHESWEEARLIARGAEVATLAGDGAPALPRQRSLAHALEARGAMTAGFRRLREAHPERVAAAARAVRDYDRLLSVLELRDDQLVAAYPPRAVVRSTARILLRLLALLPLAALGTALNLLPYLAVRAIARRSAAPSLTATLKLYPALAIYPLCWAGAAWLVHRWAGPAWGTLALLAGPLCGWSALRFHERRERFADEARAYLFLRGRRDLAEELRQRRQGVRAEIQALARDLDGSA